MATTVALALGAGFALLPLIAGVCATCLLLLNQVRWAFLLQPQQRILTGRRQGGTFPGYAAPSLETPKPRQRIEYQTRGGDEDPLEPAPTGGAAVAARIERALAPRAPGGPSGASGSWPATPTRPGG